MQATAVTYNKFLFRKYSARGTQPHGSSGRTHEELKSCVTAWHGLRGHLREVGPFLVTFADVDKADMNSLDLLAFRRNQDGLVLDGVTRLGHQLAFDTAKGLRHLCVDELGIEQEDLKDWSEINNERWLS